MTTSSSSQEVLVADGVRIVVDRWKAPPPPVVLLHSGVTDRRSWTDVVDRLAGEVDLVSYDRRGHGRTPPGSSAYRDLDDLLAVLDAVTDEPVVLVGNSMGGQLALDTALTAPERVAALLLLAPAVSGLPEPSTIDAATLVLGERLDRAVADRDEAEVARLEAWLWLDGPAVPEGRVEGQPRVRALEMSRQIFAHGAPEDAGGSGLAAWPRLGEISVPALVACGDLDVGFLQDQSRQLAARLPLGEFRELPGTAHLPSLDQPDTVAELILETVRGVR